MDYSEITQLLFYPFTFFSVLFCHTASSPIPFPPTGTSFLSCVGTDSPPSPTSTQPDVWSSKDPVKVMLLPPFLSDQAQHVSVRGPFHLFCQATDTLSEVYRRTKIVFFTAIQLFPPVFVWIVTNYNFHAHLNVMLMLLLKVVSNCFCPSNPFRKEELLNLFPFLIVNICFKLSGNSAGVVFSSMEYSCSSGKGRNKSPLANLLPVCLCSPRDSHISPETCLLYPWCPGVVWCGVDSVRSGVEVCSSQSRMSLPRNVLCAGKSVCPDVQLIALIQVFPAEWLQPAVVPAVAMCVQHLRLHACCSVSRAHQLVFCTLTTHACCCILCQHRAWGNKALAWFSELSTDFHLAWELGAAWAVSRDELPGSQNGSILHLNLMYTILGDCEGAESAPAFFSINISAFSPCQCGTLDSQYPSNDCYTLAMTEHLHFPALPKTATRTVSAFCVHCPHSGDENLISISSVIFLLDLPVRQSKCSSLCSLENRTSKIISLTITSESEFLTIEL
ncbi:hypothetical protein EK904_008506 [Melospiza melodia maxima]|nr:hypothetical protein EK904_008506 [Melospiza melodia maxima]